MKRQVTKTANSIKVVFLSTTTPPLPALTPHPSRPLSLANMLFGSDLDVRIAFNSKCTSVSTTIDRNEWGKKIHANSGFNTVDVAELSPDKVAQKYHDASVVVFDSAECEKVYSKSFYHFATKCLRVLDLSELRSKTIARKEVFAKGGSEEEVLKAKVGYVDRLLIGRKLMVFQKSCSVCTDLMSF